MKLPDVNLPQNPESGYDRRLSVALYDFLRQVRAGVNSSADVQASQELALFRGINLDMAVTTDQALTALSGVSRYLVTRVVAVNRSGGTTVACAGGIYSGASKTGTAIVAAAQSWLNLSASNKVVIATLAAVAGTDAQTSTTQYLSLTTGSTAACRADVYVYGIPI